MTSFITNILWNSVEGFVEAGTRTAGEYAGDALIKAGDLIEGSGRNVGSKLERTASGYGQKISGQNYNPGSKALPSTSAKNPAVKRSNSSPASTRAVGPTSRVPIGGNKYPGGKGVPSIKGTGVASRQITNGVSGTKGAIGGAQRTIGSGAGIGSAQKAIGGTKSPPKPYPNNVPYGTSTTPSPSAHKSKTTSSLSSAKGIVEHNGANLTRPYPSNASAYSSEKKSAVRPGRPKEFKLPGGGGAGNAVKDEGKKAYSGTSTYPGEGKKTPVRPQKYKPIERMKGTTEKGKMTHISV
ncbi:uncharacterized protein BDR25DRAFT_275048 [Lindgomyces ingoldianus]|uniref:Uncharacterized protein n=1 Tax=Lindgomyces ingoldianus TaxID=673940 RepID=A0ACB6RES9_9PLEO|nr:uncharacterized protein BDR25DRAFT_275048 [Lindgomyces ingoldianus]KAF2477706.1 hypothetical protein BDR25DRAFT_275048 [Lindgomyces ingoldianus]